MPAIQDFHFDAVQKEKIQASAKAPFVEGEFRVVETLIHLHLNQKQISNKIIASILSLRDRTVNNYMNGILAKLPGETRAHRKEALIEFVCTTLDLKPPQPTVEEIVKGFSRVEKQLVILAGEGHREAELYDGLERAGFHVSPEIAEACLERIIAKLGVGNIDGLAVWAIENRAALAGSALTPSSVAAGVGAGAGSAESGEPSPRGRTSSGLRGTIGVPGLHYIM